MLTVKGQETVITVLNQSDSLDLKEKPPLSFRFGVDLFRIIKSQASNDFQSFEAVADLRISEDFYIAAEVGNEKVTKQVEQVNFTTNGTYYKIGFDFNMFDNWMQKYEYMIDLGKDLPIISPKYKTNNNLIKGCQSRVWLHAEKVNDKIIYTADSDAIMTKGIIAILIRALSNQKPHEISNSSLSFIDDLGLKEQLSATRANGLVSMIKEMKIYALAFNK